MNKIYKLIWSKAKNCWVVASELAKGHGKNKSRAKNSLLAVAVMSALLGSALFPADMVYAADGAAHYVNVAVNTGKTIEARKYPGEAVEESAVDPTVNYDLSANPTINAISIGAETSAWNNGAVAMGFKTTARGEYATALGTGSAAYSKGDLALGWKAYTGWNQPNKIAIGTESTALKENGISIGTKSKTWYDNAIAIGNEAETGNEGGQTSNDSIAIGNKAKIQGQKNVAIGSGVTVGTGSTSSGSSYVVAIGSDSHAYDTDSVVIGGHSEVHENAVVVGNRSKAGMQSVAVGSSIEAGEWSVAIGLESKAKNHAIAMGYSSEASAADSVAFGNNAKANALGAIAIGSDHDSSIGAAQAYSTDTIAIGRGSVAGNKDDTTTAYNTVAIGVNAKAAPDYASKKVKDAVLLGANTTVKQERGTAVGANAYVDGVSGAAFGDNASVIADEGLAIGKNAKVAYNSAQSIAIGSGAEVKNENAKPSERAVAIGTGVVVGGNSSDSIAIGTGAKTQGVIGAQRSIVIGKGAVVKNDDSVAIGTNASTDWYNSVAIGNGAQATLSDGIALGSDSKTTVSSGYKGYDPYKNAFNIDAKPGAAWESTKAALSVGDVGNNITRQITSVAAGRNDTDAVNVAQLKKLRDYTDTKMNIDLGNITPKGIDKVKDWAQEAIDVKSKKNDYLGIEVANSASSPNKKTYYLSPTQKFFDKMNTIDKLDRRTTELEEGWDLKLTTETEEETSAVQTLDVVEFGVANADSGLTVTRETTDAETEDHWGATKPIKKYTIKFGIDSAKLVENINSADPAVTNISAKFGVTDGTNTKAVNLGRGQNNNVTFQGKDGETVVTVGGANDAPTVTVGLAEAFKQKIDKGAIHYFSVRSDDSAAPEGTNWNNDGASGHNAVAIGSFAKAMQKSATAVGAKTAAAGKGANAYGGGIAAGEGTVAIGQNAVAASKPGITQEEYDALTRYQQTFYISDNNGLYYQYQYQQGKRTRDEQNYNVAIGSGAESYANQTVSLGYKAKSDIDGGVAIGAESSANRQAGGIGYIATGSSATFEDALTTLNKKEDYDKWTAIVDASKKEYGNLTKKFDLAKTKESKDKAKAALDAWKEQHADFVEALAAKEKLEATWKATTAAVSVGKDEINEAGNRVIASRQITNVAAGTEDTDAVNVAQLKTAKTTVEAGDYVTVEKGTKEGTDGTIYTVTGPTLSIDGGNLTVADDEKDGKKVGYKLSLNKELTGLTSVSSDTFKSGENVTINNKGLTITGGPSVTTDGINAGDKKITNVKDGDISETSTDAVNGKQLYELKQNVAENKVTVEAAKDSQITVTAEKQADKSTKYVVDIEKDGTIGGAKDGNLVTGKTVKDYVDANKVTVTGDEDGSGVKVENIAEDGQPANYKVSLGDKVKVGNVVIDDKDGKGSISGLSEVTVGDNVTLDKTGLTIKEGPSVTTKGIDAGKKKITNVADGDVSENSTDAVNGGQLYKLQQTVAGNKVTVEAAANSQITVSAETQADKSTKYVVDIAKDGTIGGAKDGNLVTGETVKEYVDANKTTVTGDEESGIKVENIAEDGQPANYKVSLGDKIKAGDVTIDGTKDKGQITGLSNTTWDAENIVSGRAATEDQLKQVSENAVAEAAKKQTTLVAGDYVTVSEGTNAAGGKEYTVTGPKLAVADGEENLVVGDITEGGKKVGYNLKLNKELKGLTSVSSDTFKSGDNVTINKDGLTIKDGPSVKKDGIDAGGKTITNVKDGKADTDAVNVRQLNAIANEGNQNIAILGGKVGELGNRVNRVGAGAAALAALHPLDFDPDDKWDFAAGYGNYKGANAAAIGAYYRPNEDTMVSVGGSFGGGENMVNAGVSVKLGQGNHVTTSRVAMAKEIKDLRAEVEVLRQAVTGIGQGQTPDPVKMKLFPDIAKNHWAYEAVEELTKQGLLEGYPDGTFGGDRMMTRYEFAEIVYRAMQKGLNVNEKLIQEFEPELERFRIDVISKDKNGNPVIERVRVNEKKKAK